MKINLPVFKDEDKKDAVTYQSWHWDKMVYHQAGYQDHTLLFYVICSLEGYQGQLVRSLGTDINLDGMIAVLDEHYNNVKALDALNQEPFQPWMANKEMVSDWGVCLLRHLQILVASFLERFPPDHIAELKWDCFYGGLPKQLKAMVAYLKATANEKTYSDYLWARQEAKKEETMETSWTVAMVSTSKLRATSFFPLQKLKGSQPGITPSVQMAHLEEKITDEEGINSGEKDGIEGVPKEFIVCIARALKDAQQRSIVITVTAKTTSSVTAHGWQEWRQMHL